MKAGWWDASLALQDLAKAIPIISGNGLPLLTEINFQTPPPLPFIWTAPRLLIFRLSFGPPSPPLPTPLYFELESTCNVYNFFIICNGVSVTITYNKKNSVKKDLYRKRTTKNCCLMCHHSRDDAIKLNSANIFLFKVNNKNTGIDVLLFTLLILNIFHTFFLKSHPGLVEITVRLKFQFVSACDQKKSFDHTMHKKWSFPCCISRTAISISPGWDFKFPR